MIDHEEAPAGGPGAWRASDATARGRPSRYALSTFGGVEHFREADWKPGFLPGTFMVASFPAVEQNMP
jgi:hypothetical protein